MIRDGKVLKRKELLRIRTERKGNDRLLKGEVKKGNETPGNGKVLQGQDWTESNRNGGERRCGAHASQWISSELTRFASKWIGTASTGQDPQRNSMEGKGEATDCKGMATNVTNGLKKQRRTNN